MRIDNFASFVNVLFACIISILYNKYKELVGGKTTKKITPKNSFSVLVILVSIPILLTLLFLFYALIFNFYDIILPRPDMGPNPYLILRPATLFVVLAILSWFIFRSKLATLFKTIFLSAPVATVLAFIGIYFYGSPVLIYLLCALFVFGILAYLFFTKKSWLYYFSVIPVSIILLLVQILGVEI